MDIVRVRFITEKKQLTSGWRHRESLTNQTGFVGEDCNNRTNSKVRDLVVEHFLHPLVKGEPSIQLIPPEL